MKLSLDGFSFHGLQNQGRMNIYHYLETTKYRYKIDAVGIWNGMFPGQLSRNNKGIANKPELVANNSLLDSEFVETLKDEVISRNLSVPNLAVDWASPWDDIEENRIENMKNAWSHLKAGVTLGARSIRIDWGVRTDKITTKQMDCIIKAFKEFCVFAERNNIRVGPENHYGASLDLGLLLEVAQAVNSPAYGILMHFKYKYNSQTDKQIRALIPYIMHTHISQSFLEGKPDDFIKLMVEEGYSGYWGIEHHTAKNEYNMLDWQIGITRRVLSSLGIK